MSRYNTQVLSNIRMLCRMQNIDEKVLYERAKLILSIYREVCWSTIDRANDVYNLVKKKVFHSVRIGGSIRISKKSFDEWLDHQM